jgi:hypothetical protein
LLDVQSRVEVWPAVMLDGLKDAVQLGGGSTATLPVQVLVAPELLTTVRVHVWVDAGERVFNPLVPVRIPLPRSPLHV